MNFDQKAVKFLANFYINGGRHWTHAPLRQESLSLAQLQAALSLGQGPGATWKLWPLAVPEFPGRVRVHIGPLSESWLICSWHRRGCEQRPPIVMDLNSPGPTKYKVPDPSVRESSPHPHFSIGRKHPTREGGERRAWQTALLQSQSPLLPSVSREQKRPAPAGHCPPGGPAFSFGGHRPSKTAEGLLRARGQRALPPWQNPPQPPGEKRPNPNTYDILPGCRLRSLRSPAFSMSPSRSFASWVNSSPTPGPAAYHVEDCYDSRFPSVPGGVIQGVRRPKRHDTGPFCSL